MLRKIMAVVFVLIPVGIVGYLFGGWTGVLWIHLGLVLVGVFIRGVWILCDLSA